MKNILAKCLVLSIFTGALCINCNDTEALFSKFKTNTRNARDSLKYSKNEEKKTDAQLTNYERQLIELIANKQDIELRLHKNPNNAKLQKQLAEVNGKIASTKSKIETKELRLAEIKGQNANVDEMQQNIKDLESGSKNHKKDAERFFKSRTDGNLNAAKKSAIAVFKIAHREVKALGMEADAVKYLNAAIEKFDALNARVQEGIGGNQGHAFDTGQLIRNQTYGRHGDADFYLNGQGYAARYNRPNEVNERITPQNGTRQDYRRQQGPIMLPNGSQQRNNEITDRERRAEQNSFNERNNRNLSRSYSSENMHKNDYEYIDDSSDGIGYHTKR